MATETPNRFFAWMRSLGIQREPGWIGGVASGLATRLGIDPLIVRGIIVVVAVLGGPALLLYAAAWLLLPDTNDKIHLEQLIAGVFESAVAGIGVLVVLSLLPVTQGFWFAGSAFWGEPFWGAAIGRALWTAVLIGLAVWFVVWIARRASSAPASAPKTPSPTPPAATAPAADFTAWREQQAAWRAENAEYRRHQGYERAAAWKARNEQQSAENARLREAYLEQRRATRSNPLFSILVIGLALFAGGATALWVGNGELEVTSTVAALAVALAVLALGMLVNGLRGKRPGGAAAVAWLIVIPLAFVTVLPQNDHFQYANHSPFVPSSNPGDDSQVFVAGGGGVELDLTHFYDDTEGDDVTTETVYLFVGSGRVTVQLPDDEYVQVDARVLNGAVRTGKGTSVSRGGSAAYNAPGDDGARLLIVHIYALDGTVTIVNPEVTR